MQGNVYCKEKMLTTPTHCCVLNHRHFRKRYHSGCLKTSAQRTAVCLKNQNQTILGYIENGMENNTENMSLYRTMIYPYLEYFVQIWLLYLSGSQTFFFR